MPLPGGVQDTANSCGAFALWSALTCLGLTAPVPLRRLDTANPPDGYVVPLAPDPMPMAATNLYEVTGVLDLESQPGDATYRYTDPVSDRNAPSALVSVARSAGAETTVGIASDTVVTYQSITMERPPGDLFDSEVGLITRMGVAVREGAAYALPGPSAVQLVLVNEGAHWVAVTATQLYDPGSGAVTGYRYAVEDGPDGVFYVGEDALVASGLWLDLDT